MTRSLFESPEDARRALYRDARAGNEVIARLHCPAARSSSMVWLQIFGHVPPAMPARLLNWTRLPKPRNSFPDSTGSQFANSTNPLDAPRPKTTSLALERRECQHPR
jgi:hypothetical protein